jgi:hypothetical protein
MRTSTLVAAIVAAIAFAAPAPARAARALDLGPGAAPSAVIDAAGTAHIVWSTPDGAAYCRLPRNAQACDVRTAMPLADASGAPYIVRRSDGVLIVVQSTDYQQPAFPTGATWIQASLDSGATFSAPAPVAAGSQDLQAVLAAPDGQSLLTLDANTGGVFFQRAPFTGGETRELNVLAPSDDLDGDFAAAQEALLPDGRMMTVVDGIKSVYWRFFGGGDPFDINAWAAQGRLTGDSEADVASGPRGTYVLLHRSPAVQRLSPRAPYALRSYDAKRARWRPTQSAGADFRPFGSAALAEDAKGRLHVVSADDDVIHVGCVVYSRTSTRRSSWFGRSTTLYRTHARGHFPQHADVAAGADGRGVAVWDEGSAGSTGEGDVWVTPLRQAHGRYRPIANPFNRPVCP